MNVVRGPSAMARLKAATAEAHRRLEAADFILPATHDAQRYAALLRRTLRFYRPVEERMSRFTEWSVFDLNFEARRKTPALEADLRALGVTLGDNRDAEVPPLPTFAHALGCAYVLEGASLGGTLIGRAVRERLHFESRFHSVGGAAVGERWREFGAAVERYADECGQIDTMTASAEATFAAFAVALAG